MTTPPDPEDADGPDALDDELASAEEDAPGERLRVVVPAGVSGRADKVLAELVRATGRVVPRAEIQRWIEAGRITRAGVAVANRTPLAPGDALDVEATEGSPTEALPDPSVTFPVVYEDAHLLVVDKPAGLVVHPARGHRGGTLVNGLLARGGFERASADPRDPSGHLRPGIVHRLDKDTSGLLVVAKDAATREGLKALFARHDVERAYLAIAVGAVRAARWDTTHGRHPTSRLRFTSRLAAERPGVRRAVTKVEPLETLAGGRATLVRCTLETGRTHQIRVHLAEQARAPLLGDPLYGERIGTPALASLAAALGRQALHAAVLGFVHPITGARLRWESPPPADFEATLAALRALA